MKLTTEQVAKEMNVSISFVRSMAKKGKLPFAIVTENESKFSYYFDKERFEAWKQGRI